MNLFVLGMRRSGTTILHDALLADPGLRCHYEPLREEDVTEGGGSGARAGDAFAETRALRRRFRDREYPQLPLEEFNWGGPRRPPLELEPDLPEHCRAFLAELLAGGPASIKETRLHHKVAVLAELDPGAALVHVVRDPRAVAASIVLGRGRRRLETLPTPDHFFADRSKRKLWSCRSISKRLLELREHAGIVDPSNPLRVLLVWKHAFERTRADGERLFGGRYVQLRNEDLRADPAAALASLYAALGRHVPDAVAAWARRAVRPPEEPYAADDPRWGEELERAGMSAAVEAAGYPEALAGRGARLKP